MGHSDLDPAIHDRSPWNAGKNVGPKRPLKPRDIWAIRFYLDEHRRLSVIGENPVQETLSPYL